MWEDRLWLEFTRVTLCSCLFYHLLWNIWREQQSTGFSKRLMDFPQQEVVKKKKKYACLRWSIELWGYIPLLLGQCTIQEVEKCIMSNTHTAAVAGRRCLWTQYQTCALLSVGASPRVITAVVLHRWENICGKAASLIGWKLCNHYLALQHNKHDSCAPRRNSTSAAAARAAWIISAFSIFPSALPLSTLSFSSPSFSFSFFPMAECPPPPPLRWRGLSALVTISLTVKSKPCHDWAEAGRSQRRDVADCLTITLGNSHRRLEKHTRRVRWFKRPFLCQTVACQFLWDLHFIPM